MSTHNICFHGKREKIILEISQILHLKSPGKCVSVLNSL